MKPKKALGVDPGQLIGGTLRMMCRDLAYRIDEKNKDCFILIVAALGDGKSTLGSELCFFMDTTFSAARTVFRDYHYYKVKRDLTRGYDPIKRPALCKKKAILFDEIKRYLLAKESMKPEAVELEKDLNDIRSLGFFMVGCVDDLKSATRWIRESRVQIIIYIPKAGDCWIYKLYKGEGDDDGAELVIQELKKRLLNGEHPYTQYRSTFLPIPIKSAYWRDYSIRKAKYQINSDSSRSKELLVELQDRGEMASKDYLSVRDAAKFLGINPDTLRRYYRERRYKSVRITKKNTKSGMKGIFFHKNLCLKLYYAITGLRPLSLCVLKEQQKENDPDQ